MLDVMMEEYQDIVRNTTFAHIWRSPGWNLLKMFEDDEPLTFRNSAISGVPIKYLEGRSDDSETLLSFMLDAPRYIPLPSILSNGRVLSGELMNAMRANPLDTSRGLVFPTVNNMSHGANLIHHLAVSRDSFVFELWRSMRTRFQRIQSSHPHFSAVRVRRRVIREMMARFDQGKVSRVMSFLLIPFLSIYKTAADIPSIYHLSLHTETMDTDILGEQDDLEEGVIFMNRLRKSSTHLEKWRIGLVGKLPAFWASLCRYRCRQDSRHLGE
ncbi:hypothetical protein BLNAU_14322 [Blattamonas nauphoetae]|uniref:Uncharacterized protein n=1 Tax=Blattamonas nauphoetae TaxID=2049346 RepID=A0ABQ9XK79_9EUKA|nr:hypothetical protein BLNAU_14322 [Blattamonas nauphoetae]